MSRGVVLSLFPRQYLLEPSTCIIIDSFYRGPAKVPYPSGDRDQSGDESHHRNPEEDGLAEIGLTAGMFPSRCQIPIDLIINNMLTQHSVT